MSVLKHNSHIASLQDLSKLFYRGNCENWIFLRCQALMVFLRPAATKPNIPVPNNHIAAGTGTTVVAVSVKFPISVPPPELGNKKANVGDNNISPVRVNPFPSTVVDVMFST